MGFLDRFLGREEQPTAPYGSRHRLSRTTSSCSGRWAPPAPLGSMVMFTGGQVPPWRGAG